MIELKPFEFEELSMPDSFMRTRHKLCSTLLEVLTEQENQSIESSIEETANRYKLYSSMKFQ